VAAPSPAGFTLVLLPDTQNYSEKSPETYLRQTEWIAQHAAAENIRFVIHLGDIVQNATVEDEWKAADRAQRVLDGVVPYSVLPGNHDGAPDATDLYNRYFPPERFECRPSYGGHMNGKNDASYSFFYAGGMALMVISLGNDPSEEMLQWAGKIADWHPDHRVIVATHMYMGAKKRNEVGQRIWDQLIRKHANIFMVVCGHVGAAAYLNSTNDAGGTVHEVLCDYQNKPHGGDGWLELLRFTPQENKIRFDAYSPSLDEHNPKFASVAEIDYDMSGTEDTAVCRSAACRAVQAGKHRARVFHRKPLRRLLGVGS